MEPDVDIDPESREAAIVAATQGCAPRIAEAMRHVPRERFVDPEVAEHAYANRPLPLSDGQLLPPLRAIAQLIDALALSPTDRVLQIGTGSGYIAAVIAHLAKRVFTLERIQPLAQQAAQHCVDLGLRNVEVRHGEGDDGWPEAGPFHAILMPASSEGVPAELLEQLAIGGRLVIPVGETRVRRQLFRVTRTPDGMQQERLGMVHYASRIGDILIALGAAERVDVEDAARLAEARHASIGSILVSDTPTEEVDVYRGLSLQKGIPFSLLDDLLDDLDPELSSRVPPTYVEHNRIIPIALGEDGKLLCVTDNPDASFEGLEQAFNARGLEAFLITPTDYKRLRTALELGATSTANDKGDEFESTPDLMDASTDQRVVALLEALLLEAVGERASDIHFERYGDRVRIRLRVDGELRDLKHFKLTPDELTGLISVLKITAELDIAERRLPQGGRFRRRLGGRVFDMRVQTQPSLYGEHAVIRLLAQDSALLSIEDLGLDETVAKHYRRLLISPAGLVLVVGPTGSGKSTTLYAGLQVLARDPTRKVITAEDPIEYSIHGVQQTRIRPEIGFPFAQAMRSFVRQDPDIILVGEIRDTETALEAIRASQTGHLVLSTLHANDAIDAVQRLLDLGLHPNSIASELLAIFAQRLAKRICKRCKQPDPQPDPDILAELFPGGPPPDFSCHIGRGCVRCHGSGTYGRVGVIEFMSTGPIVRKAIAHRLSTDEMRELAIDGGLQTMRNSALALVRAGTIPLSELPRILPAERMSA